MRGEKSGLAGIRAGFHRLTVRPQPVGGLTWVKAWHDTVRGCMESSWKKDEFGLVLTVKNLPAVRGKG
jgi:alpha-L-rhamnosidase